MPLYKFLHNMPIVLVQIANTIELKKHTHSFHWSIVRIAKAKGINWTHMLLRNTIQHETYCRLTKRVWKQCKPVCQHCYPWRCRQPMHRSSIVAPFIANSITFPSSVASQRLGYLAADVPSTKQHTAWKLPETEGRVGNWNVRTHIQLMWGGGKIPQWL
jgi:hypothetical protein